MQSQTDENAGRTFRNRNYLGDPVNNEGQIAFQLTTSSGKEAVVCASPAQATVPFETLARSVAYGKLGGVWAVDDHVFHDGVDLGYTVARVFDGGVSGFYALGLESDLYGPALVIRGTQPSDLADWWTNTDREGVGFSQFKMHWRAGQKVRDWLTEELTEPADFVGHSLGGALAQWMAADFTSDPKGWIDQLVTFNSPGISVEYANRFDPDKATKVTHYVVNGDIASMAGDEFLAGEVKMASFSDLLLFCNFNKHLLPLLVPTIVAPNGKRSHQPELKPWRYMDAAELSDPWFSYDDRDYHLNLIGLQLVLVGLSVDNLPLFGPLLPLPAKMMFRGTTEAERKRIGENLHYAAQFEWTEQTADRFTLKFRDQVHELYGAIGITVEGFTLTVDEGDPPMLKLQGGLSIDLGGRIDIDLPDWLGGSFTADHLIELADIDVNGVIDRNHLGISGELNVLGGLLTVDGGAELDWQRAELTLLGKLDILDGFITIPTTVRVGSGLNMAAGAGAVVSIPNNAPWLLRPLRGTPLVGGQFLLKFDNNGDNSDDFVAGWGSAGPLNLGLRVRLDGKWDILWGREVDSLEQQGTNPMRAAEAMGIQVPYGESYPIAAGTDWVLFAAEWENASATAALTLQTPSGAVLSEADIEADPSMTIVAELTDDHQKVVQVKEPEAGTWSVSLSDTGDLGVVNIAAFVHDSAPSVSVMSVSDGLLREPVQIDIEAFDPDSDAQVALFYDTDNEGFDGVMIASGIAETDGPAQYDWDTTGVAAGEYYVYAMALDESNPPVLAYAATPVQITDFASIAGRHAFYNNSAFDGDAEASEADDAAIAPYKEALLPGAEATFDNYTSYSRGINGIMVDIAGLPDGVTPAVADFEFHIGNDDTPGEWGPAPPPAAFAVREGAGVGGADRVTITWADDAIRNTWLEVTVLGGPDTNLGLAANDVFYFGNAVAESGNSTTDAKVTTTDLLLARNNPRSLLEAADICFPYDYNRDKRVDAIDVLLARNNQTSFLNELQLIDLSGGAEEAQGAPLAELAWLSDLDQAATCQRPAQKDDATDAVDLLLATYWPE